MNLSSVQRPDLFFQLGTLAVPTFPEPSIVILAGTAGLFALIFNWHCRKRTVA